MIDDRDVWAAALLMVKRYGDDALLEASERADQLLHEGDMAGADRPAVKGCDMLTCSFTPRWIGVCCMRQPKQAAANV